jgi:peptide deformylase
MCPYEPKHKKGNKNTMKQVIDCNQNHNPVINKKLKEVSVEEGLAIAEELFQIHNKRKDGIGLAANQVGIDAQVAIVNVREPLVLINPKIVSKENPIDYYEGCLSYPGKGVPTQRYRDIVVSTENEQGELVFGGSDEELDVLESVCVQHEIDHLMGKTIHNRKIDTTYVADVKIGRNDKCPCGSGKKYKKCCIGK